MSKQRGRRRWPLSGTLAAAFVLVGLVTAASVVSIVALTARNESASVASSARHAAAAAVRSRLASAYLAAGSQWAAADMSAAASSASAARAALIVRDASGRTVGIFSPSGQALATSGARLPAPGAATKRFDVMANDRVVGRAELRFAGTGLTRSEQRLRDALVRSAVIASFTAIVVALLVAAVVLTRLRRPLRHMARAARALESGNVDARVSDPTAPGELGELSVAFDSMADALASQRAARSAMVSDLAHELRTPLTILRGSLEEILDGDVAPDPTALASLQDEVLRLERLTDDLWALSESEPSFLRLSMARVDLTAIVAASAAALEPSARAGGVSIAVSGTPVCVMGDERRLGQIAGNLLVNAIKFTPDGGSVRAHVTAEDGWAMLAVSDTGPGIAPGELPHVFERFWRGEGTSEIGGSGVGLAIVERLVQAHGGTVSVTSDPGAGAQFTVRLPLA